MKLKQFYDAFNDCNDWSQLFSNDPCIDCKSCHESLLKKNLKQYIPKQNEKKTRYYTGLCGFISKLCFLFFFAILSILLQMLPMRLSGGTGVCISLTMYTSVCELMMVPRQPHTHTHMYMEHAHAQVKVRQIYTIPHRAACL